MTWVARGLTRPEAWTPAPEARIPSTAEMPAAPALPDRRAAVIPLPLPSRPSRGRVS